MPLDEAHESHEAFENALRHAFQRGCEVLVLIVGALIGIGAYRVLHWLLPL